ncbi:ubiquinone biosynthesis protein UbiJ [Franzmannia pantelleriensis]|uniref:Ubiquinone biosynthesis accessory factor UbiJ n=1 Tax=Franzmannia pantelleriensis TaxID=48727 RepID=A0A1G9QEM1_9GAMM|nr:SCP2 sterol-binding domain-containing protein [Halomonas pantelleriensis]SDM08927.1 ubiquinone biosynthesis protein UbiJ [Halomonas pantelleriensis]
MLLAGLEATLNALLARDPAAPARLEALAGKRLVVNLTTPRLCLLLQVHSQGLHLQRASTDDATDADARVELDAESLGALLGGESIERLMFTGRLAVRGNPALLEALRDLLLDLDADWEGELARLLGDQPAHQLAEGGRRLGRFGARSARQLHADISEYLFEEARLFTGHDQHDVARDLLTNVELASDRLEARIERLERRLAARPGGAA